MSVVFFHPQWVHFPIAFLILAGVAMLGSFFYEHAFLWKMGAWLTMTGLVGLLMAILTGRNAEAEVVHTQAIHELVEWHERLAYGTLWIFCLLGIWLYLRLNRMKAGEKVGFVVLFWLGIGIMGYGAHLGGEMVYREGAGVAPMESQLESQFQGEQQIQAPKE